MGDRLAPQILMSVEGYQFGFGGHFDAGCSGTISYQLQGSKFWRVWSPWETLADSTGASGYPRHRPCLLSVFSSLISTVYDAATPRTRGLKASSTPATR